MALKVLLVEDVENIQRAITEMLQGLGDYEVTAIQSTEAEALAWVEDNPGRWDLAVIDLVLAQGSGMGVISRCRRTSPSGRIVVFSNFVTPGIRAHCLRLGADAAFDKNSELTAFADYCSALAGPAATAAPPS